ncbi:AAA family ATPase [Methylobacterium sp. WL122]|nr:AAA family ATPase [Methylobacterium sp. WL122]
MTSFNPHLSIRRLIVKKGPHEAYNAAFHPRLNIISGENSSGKSTVLDFIFYGLGGDVSDWREAALNCTEVIIEVGLNGHSAVFSREISETAGRPMRIFLGSLDDAANSTDWGLYPYRRSENKDSFSQVIFRLLGMPEATGDAANNITMHQLLRILYADQLSPVDKIFRSERFDTALTRQTVGDLLCGAYDNTLYRDKIRVRDAGKEYDEATAEWRLKSSVFVGAKHAINSSWVEAERQSLQKELDYVHLQAEELESKIFHAEVSNGLSLEEQNRTYDELVNAQQQLSKLRGARDELQLEIADSERYIESLKTKLIQLHDAEASAEVLRGISFIYCPSCYAPVEQDHNEHACSLCKNPFDTERAHVRILSIINEVGLQLKQSRSIQSDRFVEIADLDGKLSLAINRWNSINEKYKLLNRVPSTELRGKARGLYSRAGYLEREIEDLARKQATIEQIEALVNTRKILDAEILDLRDKIEAGERRQTEQLARAYTLISKASVSFLRRDLARQDTFSNAETIQFDFSQDRLSVNGESFFSASSMVYLRNSFFAGFFAASLVDSSFRHPRFLMLDTIEDKGMEPERSHRFQNLLEEISLGSKVENQIIYATAMISPKLKKSSYVVDRFYTHLDRTLNISKSGSSLPELHLDN